MEQYGIGEEFAHSLLSGAVHGVISKGNISLANSFQVKAFPYVIQVHRFQVDIFQ